jgi:hypothetical protein
MKHIILSIALFFSSIVVVSAQNASSTANQDVSLTLSNAISITFTGTGTTTGSTVNMAFNNVNDYVNGVASTAQQLKVQSNTNFNVAVRYDPNSFTYTGNGNLNLNNIPQNAFQARVTANNTGGSIASPFSATNYAAIYGVDQNIINNGQWGGNQTFSVMYKCVPGLSMPGGVYTVNIIYTATQQ